MPIYFWTPPTTPICLKCLKSLKFSPSWLSREKNHLKVGVYRENFNIGNVAENFFMDFYICWQYAISFSAKFPMLKFSPGPSTLAPPLSRGFFEIWLKNENDQFWGGKKIFPSILKKGMKVKVLFYTFFLKKNKFLDFFLFFTIFWKKIHVFLKKLHFTLPAYAAKFY